MRTMKLFLVGAVIFLLIAPALSSAETGQKRAKNDSSHILAASMDEYIPCYKEKDGKTVVFRRCRATFPWTPTNEKRNFCYATSEDCAKAEMPQSWCIKCGKPY